MLVIQGDTADSLARRYGVPVQALLGANGLKSAEQVHSGMHVIVPVYNAHAVSANSPTPIPAASESPRKVATSADASDDVATKSRARAKARKEAEDASDDKEVRPSKSKSKVAANEDEPTSKAKSHKTASETEDEPAKRKKASGEEIGAGRPKGKKSEEPEDASSKSKSKIEMKAAEAKSAKPAPESTKLAKVEAKFRTIDASPNARVAPSTPTEAPKTAAEADAAGANPEFRWPARGRIIQGFKAGGNDGINISVPEGTSVRAAESGVVAYAGSELKGYGNLILIKHPNGFVTAYADNGEIDVKKGDQVKRGQVIAKSGESGNVSSPQLHFELRDKSGQPVDPTNFLAGI